MKHLRTRRNGLGLMILLLIAAALAPMAAASVDSGAPPGLFVEASEARLEYTAPDSVIRHRVVGVNLDALLHATGQARIGADLPEVTLNLFDDAVFTGRVTASDDAAGTASWVGNLEGIEGGQFFMVYTAGTFAAHVALPGGIFEVSWAGDGLYRAVEIDQSVFVDHPPETGDLAPPQSVSDLQPTAPSARRADTGATIDVLVLYTEAARLSAGGTAAMLAQVSLAMLETNTSYANADIVPRLRLVHAAEVPYAEPAVDWGDPGGEIFANLNSLENGTDGLGSVQKYRNQFGADIVGMIVAYPDGPGGQLYPFCGVAAGIWPTEDRAYQVTNLDCATGYYSFGHEFGHLQGARHDAYVDDTAGYAHGWVHPFTALEAEQWRTVMAYNDRCADWGYNCTRLPFWSNPGVKYGGDRMGARKSKNFRVLNETAFDVANHRRTRIADDFNSTFNRNSRGWKPIAGNWGLNTNTGAFWSAGIENGNASAAHAGKYGDLTYEVEMKRQGCADCANRVIIRGNYKKLTAEDMWRPQYLFQYSNDGFFSVWRIKPNGNDVMLHGWEEHAAIKNGKWNTIKIVAVGSSLEFYINDQLVWSGTDSQLMVGQVGVGFYRDDSNGNKLFVDSASVFTTATAGAAPDARLVPGVPVGGGDIDQSP